MRRRGCIAGGIAWPRAPGMRALSRRNRRPRSSASMPRRRRGRSRTSGSRSSAPGGRTSRCARAGDRTCARPGRSPTSATSASTASSTTRTASTAKTKEGKPIYNWSYVDQIYDGVLAIGVRPFVELGFMPSALAASQKPHPFWYKPLPNPPKSYEKWGELVGAFTRHLVERYGVNEVRQWYFEVWNEPNIDFWTGQPAKDTYFQLYESAAQGGEGRRWAVAHRRARDGAGGLGRRFHPALLRQGHPGRLRVNARLWDRLGQGRLPYRRKDPPGRDGGPRGAEGLRRGQGLAPSRTCRSSGPSTTRPT